MTADAREHADMDFSIQPERFEALQQGRVIQGEPGTATQREEEARRGSAVGVVEQQQQQQHKSPKILRHISGSIRRKMKS